MDFRQFTTRFSLDQEIGRATTDAQLSVYFDGGVAVGVWRHDRSTTQGRGEILSEEDARLARSWFNRLKSESASRLPGAFGPGR